MPSSPTAEIALPAAGTGRRPFTRTERNWCVAVAIVLGSALLFAGVQWLETSRGLLSKETRLVWHPMETSTRFLALSHFLVALVFMSTSRRMRRASSWGQFGGLLALGVVLCLGFSGLGGIGAPIAGVLFYAYFLVHEFRDQAMFFRSNGDAPAEVDARRQARDLLAAPLLVFGAIATTFLVVVAFGLGGAKKYRAVFAQMGTPARAAIGIAALVLMAVLVAAVRRRYGRGHASGWKGFVGGYRPIFFVFFGIYAVLMLDVLLTGRVYAIVNLHVTAWYVFMIRQLAARPAPASPPRPWTWPWMRGTVGGFNVLHLGMAALVVAVGALHAYGFRNAPDARVLHWLVSKEAFPYWTIMHVTVSFLPK